MKPEPRIRILGKRRSEIQIPHGYLLISYDRPVAALLQGRFFRTSKFHSLHTTRHINKWIREAPSYAMDQEWFWRILKGEDYAIPPRLLSHDPASSAAPPGSRQSKPSGRSIRRYLCPSHLGVSRLPKPSED